MIIMKRKIVEGIIVTRVRPEGCVYEASSDIMALYEILLGKDTIQKNSNQERDLKFKNK